MIDVVVLPGTDVVVLDDVVVGMLVVVDEVVLDDVVLVDRVHAPPLHTKLKPSNMEQDWSLFVHVPEMHIYSLTLSESRQ